MSSSTTTPLGPGSARAAWALLGPGAAALAASMGVGRFVYTPILPLMTARAGLSAASGASLATANYLGYFAGALLGMFAPALTRSANAYRGSLVVLTGSLALMPGTDSVPAWFGLRLLAGVASGVVFVFAVNSTLSHLRDRPPHLTGWVFGGVGLGIALSGAGVLVIRSAGDWRTAWWATAALCGVFAIAAWRLRPEPAPGPDPAAPARAPRTHRWFFTLLGSYTLEGVGYIIAGTFLVAAISQRSPGGLGGAAWILVGLAAAPSTVLWSRLSRRWSRPGLLTTALLVQAAGIALPALLGGTAAALAGAALFGATFMGVGTLALTTDAHLRFPRSVALLTAGYSLGQVLGPLVSGPLLRHGYQQALVLGALIVLAAAAAAGLLRIGFPRPPAR
ncbi:YbfB/YjiJ family MFS transporter [Amycolatopsis sp. PS_44_ISF1]|uniref:YbfB/YjiJ family MFS transporter n=1 Tax=Amycolatopsis sp. PS_44_ISF1 TaxID=2974917 RepID=UPI0028DE2EED|nr:YbfB/YjiJ family MFS transporter [Amycolatopsis sp. PS_44_ISF1]MDT8913119.1 YbfB/YjiJ family MFS transporter [Amycolatopsis sp. PS_44_ISF1]